MLARTKRVLALAAAFVVAASACSPAATTGQTSQNVPKVLTIAWGFDPKMLHSLYVLDHGAFFISQLIYDNLVRVDLKGGVHPDLAQTWESNAEATSWTFHLAKNVKWHDGKPFTAADVKWTIESIVAKKGLNYTDLTSITSIETPDDSTITFKLKDSNPRLPSMLYGTGDVTRPILPKHLYDGTDVLTNKYNFEPVGTGPFKFVEHVTGDHLTVDANPEYFAGRVPLDRVVFKMVPNVQVAMASLESGESGYMYPRPPFTEIPRLQKTSGVGVHLFTGAYTWWLRFNQRPEALHEPFKGPNNRQVRQALSMAIDKNDINQKVFGGLSKPAEGVWSSVSWAFNPTAKEPAFNIAQAEKLLDDSGYRRGPDGIRFKMQLMIITGWEGGAAESMATVIKEHLKKIGVDVTVDSFDASTTFAKRQTGQFDTFLASTDYGPDPAQTAIWLKSTGTANFYGSKNPEVDRLYDEGNGIADQNQRKQIYFRLQQVFIDEMTNLSLIESATAYTFRDEWTGWFFQDPTLSSSFDLSKVKHK